jgi:ankyrin repeat protein
MERTGKKNNLKAMAYILIFYVANTYGQFYQKRGQARKEIEQRIALKQNLNTPLKTIPCYPPLLEALKAPLHDLIEPLLQAGANPNLFHSINKITPLLLASRDDKQVECMVLLLRYKADPSITDYRQETPLLVAMKCESYAIAKVLLEHKADPNAQDNVGNTPLILACTIAQMKNRVTQSYDSRKLIIAYLLYHGANPLIKNSRENDALDVAYENNFLALRRLMQGARPLLIAQLSTLLSKGVTPFVQDVAQLIAEYRYNLS